MTEEIDPEFRVDSTLESGIVETDDTPGVAAEAAGPTDPVALAKTGDADGSGSPSEAGTPSEGAPTEVVDGAPRSGADASTPAVPREETGTDGQGAGAQPAAHVADPGEGDGSEVNEAADGAAPPTEAGSDEGAVAEGAEAVESGTQAADETATPSRPTPDGAEGPTSRPDPPVVVEVQESTTAPLERVDPGETARPEAAGAGSPDGDPVAGSGGAATALPARQDDGPAAAAEGSSPPPPVFETRTVETNDGGTMAYRIGGAGERTLVFVHGWCGNAGQWSALCERLAAKYRVVAVDLIGHGDSATSTRDAWTIPGFGDDVALLIEKADLRQVVLVGHAMGGPVSLEAASRAPQRVIGVVGVDSLHRLGGEPDPQRLEEAATKFAGAYEKEMAGFIGQTAHEDTSEEVRKAILDDALECAPSVAVALMRHFGTYLPRTVAPRVECAVAVINSSSVETDVEGNRSLIPSFTATIIPDVGHWPHLEAPERFVPRLVEAVQTFSPEAPVDGPTRLTALHPVLYADRPTELAAFYEKELRFEATSRLNDPDGEGLEQIQLARDGVTITIQSTKSRARDLGEAAARDTHAVLHLLVSDYEVELRKLSRDLRDKRLSERQLPGGSKQITLPDPAGNVIILQQGKATNGNGAVKPPPE